MVFVWADSAQEVAVVVRHLMGPGGFRDLVDDVSQGWVLPGDLDRCLIEELERDLRPRRAASKDLQSLLDLSDSLLRSRRVGLLQFVDHMLEALLVDFVSPRTCRVLDADLHPVDADLLLRLGRRLSVVLRRGSRLAGRLVDRPTIIAFRYSPLTKIDGDRLDLRRDFKPILRYGLGLHAGARRAQFDLLIDADIPALHIANTLLVLEDVFALSILADWLVADWLPAFPRSVV